jgi:hypothetical protein
VLALHVADTSPDEPRPCRSRCVASRATDTRRAAPPGQPCLQPRLRSPLARVGRCARITSACGSRCRARRPPRRAELGVANVSGAAVGRRFRACPPRRVSAPRSGRYFPMGPIGIQSLCRSGSAPIRAAGEPRLDRRPAALDTARSARDRRSSAARRSHGRCRRELLWCMPADRVRVKARYGSMNPVSGR